VGTLSCINNNAVSTRIAMTSQSPRIYIYKITFEEVLYYYYGVHKEKKFGENYMGSPITHKWVWEFYTPKKQILQFFDFTDEGWLEAQEVEQRLIKPFYNTDKWCLNESCGGKVSLEIRRKNGQKAVKTNKKNKTSIFSLSKEQLSENGKKGGKKSKKLKLGFHKLSLKERIENSRRGGKTSGKRNKINNLGIFSLSLEETMKNAVKGGRTTKKLGLGIHALTKEQRINNGRLGGEISGQKTYELGIGIHGLSREEMVILGKKKYENRTGIHGRTKEEMSEHGKKAVKITNSQVWECTVTGYRTTSGPLTKYQKARGIDTSNRIRIK
jgi:hypothetical protein